MQKTNKLILTLAFAIYLFLLSWLIIFKCNTIVGDLFFGFRSINFIPYKYLLAGGQALDYSLNIVAYIPFGVFISLIFTKKPLAFKVIIIILSSVLYEAFQFIFAFGSCDISDVISNSLGGALGLILFGATKKFFTPKAINAISLGIIIIGAPLCVYAIISTAYTFPHYFL